MRRVPSLTLGVLDPPARKLERRCRSRHGLRAGRRGSCWGFGPGGLATRAGEPIGAREQAAWVGVLQATASAQLGRRATCAANRVRGVTRLGARVAHRTVSAIPSMGCSTHRRIPGRYAIEGGVARSAGSTSRVDTSADISPKNRCGTRVLLDVPELQAQIETRDGIHIRGSIRGNAAARQRGAR